MKDFFARYADRILIKDADQCWVWTGATASAGYGHSHRGGHHFYAHRTAYESVHGDGSAHGFIVRHSCDNPPCCNPNHLEIGNQHDNTMDSVRRGRARRAIGRDVYTTILSADEVRRIREMAALGVSKSQIARTFGTCHSNVTAIVDGRTWRHLL